MCLYGQLRALQARQAGEIGGDRIIDRNRVVELGGELCGARQKVERSAYLRCLRTQYCLIDERGKAGLFTFGQQLLRISRIVVAAQSLIQRMLRKLGLYQHAAACSAAAGTSRDLGQAREQAFAGAKIGAVERAVGIDDANQIELGEIMALGEDLGAARISISCA